MIRTVVVEPLDLVRGGLVALLGREGDMDVVAELSSLEGLVPVALAARPHVAVISAELLDERVATMRERVPECRVLVLADPGQPFSLRRAVDFHAGGFLVKDVPAAHFAEAVRGVAKGERVVDPHLALAALEIPLNPLTPREMDVLRMAATGAPTAEIASRLCLAEGTVRNHLASITVKTGARTRLEAVRIAARSGWIHDGVEPEPSGGGVVAGR